MPVIRWVTIRSSTTSPQTRRCLSPLISTTTPRLLTQRTCVGYLTSRASSGRRGGTESAKWSDTDRSNLVNRTTTVVARHPARVTRQILLDMSYVGSKGTRLFINEDANPLVPPTSASRPQAIRDASVVWITRRAARTVRTNGVPRSITLDNSRDTAPCQQLHGHGVLHMGQDMTTPARSCAGRCQYRHFDVCRSGPSLAVIGSTAHCRCSTEHTLPHSRMFMRSHTSGNSADSSTSPRRLPGFGGHQFESGVPFTVANGLESNGITGQDRPNHTQRAARCPGRPGCQRAGLHHRLHQPPMPAMRRLTRTRQSSLRTPTYTFGLAGAVGALARWAETLSVRPEPLTLTQYSEDDAAFGRRDDPIPHGV